MTIPLGVTDIGDGAFDQCFALASVTIPSSVTRIGDGAFNSCDDLTSVTISSGVTSIGKRAFSYCDSLPSVTIPSSVTSVGDNAFGGCGKMTAIHVESRNDSYCSVDGVLYDKAKSVLLQCPAGKTGSVTIPPGVTSIADSAFDRCVLTSMTIPSSVTRIGSSAFEYCRALAEVFVDLGDANRVKGLIEGSESNLDVSRIKFIEPESLSISGAASVSSVTTATYTCTASFADGSTKAVTPEWSIADGSGYATISASGVLTARKVTSPQSVTVKAIYTEGAATKTGTKMVTVNPPPEFEISGGTLTKYNGAGGAVVIPSSVTRIGDSAFEYSGLSSVVIPSSVTSIGSHAFYNCSRLASVTIPSSVTNIGECAFGWCKSLTSVTIPPSVISIGNGAFERCDSLTVVTISSGVVNIGERAFSQCKSLTSVTIPASVKSIGDYAFCYCNSLTSVTFNGDAPSGNLAIFGDNAPGCTAYVNKDSTGWGVKIPGKWMGVKIEYRMYDYTVRFDGNGGEGEMPELVLFRGQKQALMENAFTRSGYTFAGWATTADGPVAYANCALITNLVPAGGSITLYAVWTVVSTTYTVSFNANGGAGTMTSQTIASGVSTSLKANAFTRSGYIFSGWSKTAGGSVVYANGASVANLASAGGSVTLYVVWTAVPSDFEIFEGALAKYKGSGGSETIPMGVTSIAYSAIAYCSSLTSVTIPSSVTSIGNGAFDGCDKLKTVYVSLGDTERVRNLLAASGFSVGGVEFVEPTTYTVSFSANGGSGTMASETEGPGRVYKLPACTFTPPAGKRFAGWACSNGRRYDDGMLVFDLAEPGETVTMTAIWE